ncbi:MAG: ABC transporter ATP-binding protein [Acidimicrobiia bacterium]
MTHAAGTAGPLLEIVEVTKTFGLVVACQDVSIDVGPGEVRGLLGQNGAGKTTLMNVVAGVVAPNAGEVRVRGALVPPGDAVAAGDAGVGVVHQHFSLIAPLTVWENVTLGERGRMNPRKAVRAVEEIGERYGLSIDPHARVAQLSPGERQRVEIIKCLGKDPSVVILDEPTSVLTQAESRRLFEVLRALVREEGRAVVLISHRLEEILEATDHVTVMRDGRVVTTMPTGDTTASVLANEMLGREVSLSLEGAAVGVRLDQEQPITARTVGAAPRSGDGAPVVQIEDAVVLGADGRRLLDELCLGVWRGEILGVAGVEGNGQQALVDVLSGLMDLASGSVRVSGEEIAAARRTRLRRVGVIPADRHESGCVLGMSVMENLLLGGLDQAARYGVLSPRRMAERAAALLAQYDVKAESVKAPMWSLSGGNQQRLVLARELSRSPSLLVAAQPTRGLDVGAMEDMWQRLRSVATAGTAVLLISTELDEILALADRVAVIQKGRIVGTMGRDEVDTERLGLMMGGRVA